MGCLTSFMSFWLVCIFIFCKLLIKEYAKAHNDEFDYEVFCDFIKSEEAKEERYQELAMIYVMNLKTMITFCLMLCIFTIN